MKTVTKEELRQIKLAAALLASLASLRAYFSDYDELIISGFAVCKFKIEERENK